MYSMYDLPRRAVTAGCHGGLSRTHHKGVLRGDPLDTRRASCGGCWTPARLAAACRNETHPSAPRAYTHPKETPAPRHPDLHVWHVTSSVRLAAAIRRQPVSALRIPTWLGGVPRRQVSLSDRLLFQHAGAHRRSSSERQTGAPSKRVDRRVVSHRPSDWTLGWSVSTQALFFPLFSTGQISHFL